MTGDNSPPRSRKITPLDFLLLHERNLYARLCKFMQVQNDDDITN
ncbi:hypothetical protein EMGBD1_23840 [Anaerolineaceae bacterium]|nr:hypothetical protein EMGBD1_23840 [Anaerolineaceae bacterium]